MTVYVHNLRHESLPDDPRHVYVGRAMPRRKLKGSPLGNPFRFDGLSREVVIKEYRHYLRYLLGHRDRLNDSGLRIVSAFDQLVEDARTGDLHLYCWCAPEACHADVIRSEIESALGLQP